MGIFNWFKKKSQKDMFNDPEFLKTLESQQKLLKDRIKSDKKFRESIKLQNDPILESELYWQFDEKFMESLQLKNISSLSSALLLRQQGTNIVREEPALYCVGKHNEMVLEFDHIGRGIEARNSALESLKNEEKFKNIALSLFPLFGSDYYEESIDHMISLSTSYDEGLYYFSKLKEQFPNDRNKRRYQEIKDIQSKNSRWFSAHRAILGTFYSRANAALDKGRYSGGISVLEIILASSQNSGYKLDYEEYVDLLDDMCALAIQHLMQKTNIRQQQFHIFKDEANELGCIMEKPIKYLTDFYPECLPKDKELFNSYYKSWKLIPWISEVSGWKELSSLLS
jgi:tetratricopeptide (TPR) repeat protein